jgi:hypothetical protein
MHLQKMQVQGVQVQQMQAQWVQVLGEQTREVQVQVEQVQWELAATAAAHSLELKVFRKVSRTNQSVLLTILIISSHKCLQCHH